MPVGRRITEMRFTSRKLPAAMLWLAVLVACEEAKTPVGSLRATPDEIDLAFPHYASLTIGLDMKEALDPGASPVVMVHLLDASGMVVRTFDHVPPTWSPGSSSEYTIELYQSVLAPPLDRGDYRLTMGIYDPGIGRWALRTDAEEVYRQEYAMATVRATQGSDSAPRFSFSPGWMATEPGTDVQILGRRWLRRAGVVKLIEVKRAGTVRMQLRVAPPNEQIEDLVLDEGLDEVRFDVATTCGEETWSFDGIGTHVVEVPVSPDSVASEDACEIRLEAHFQVVTRRDLGSRSLALETLAWRPD